MEFSSLVNFWSDLDSNFDPQNALLQISRSWMDRILGHRGNDSQLGMISVIVLILDLIGLLVLKVCKLVIAILILL